MSPPRHDEASRDPILGWSAGRQMYAAQGDRPTRLPLGIRSVGCLLSGLGAVAGVCFGLIVLMAFTLPGTRSATPTDWLPVLACAAFAMSPLLSGIALLTHRRWALSGAEGSLFTVAGAGFVVVYVAGPVFPGLAALGLMLLLLSLRGAAYLRRLSVRHAYRAVAGPPLLWPAQVVRVATRLQPVLRFVGGLGLLRTRSRRRSIGEHNQARGFLGLGGVRRGDRSSVGPIRRVLLGRLRCAHALVSTSCISCGDRRGLDVAAGYGAEFGGRTPLARITARISWPAACAGHRPSRGRDTSRRLGPRRRCIGYA